METFLEGIRSCLTMEEWLVCWRSGSRSDAMVGWLRMLLGEGSSGTSAVERAMQLDRLQQWLGQMVLFGYCDSTGRKDLESWFIDPEELNHGEHRPRSLSLFPPGPSAGRSAPDGWNG